MTVTFSPTSVTISLKLKQELTRDQVKYLAKSIDLLVKSHLKAYRELASTPTSTPKKRSKSDSA